MVYIHTLQSKHYTQALQSKHTPSQSSQCNPQSSPTQSSSRSRTHRMHKTLTSPPANGSTARAWNLMLMVNMYAKAVLPTGPKAIAWHMSSSHLVNTYRSQCPTPHRDTHMPACNPKHTHACSRCVHIHMPCLLYMCFFKSMCTQHPVAI